MRNSSSTMASSSHHLSKSKFILIISILFTSINGNSAQPPTNICPPFDCGNGVNIRYPFLLQAQKLEHCGYQGLNLSCHGQNPILNLSNDLYRVRSINYQENSLIVSHTELAEADNCPRITHDFTLTLINNSDVFNYTSGNIIFRFFFNCTLHPPSLPDIACLQSGIKRSFVFNAETIPEFDWHRYCESTVSVPVLEQAFDAKEHLVSSFSKALAEGFKLTWRTPAGACQLCEAIDSDGFCGYSNGTDENFFCICPGGRRSISCHEDSVVSESFELNSLGIGAIVLGGLMIVAMVFYFIQKKKVALYKPVSRK